jgi:hypothetical protein
MNSAVAWAPSKITKIAVCRRLRRRGRSSVGISVEKQRSPVHGNTNEMDCAPQRNSGISENSWKNVAR